MDEYEKSYVNSSSLYPQFYKLSLEQRTRTLQKLWKIDPLPWQQHLSSRLGETFIENYTGCFSMPIGLATYFRIQNEDYLIPMAVEESSVVAASSHGAKMAREGGGFETSSSEPIMTGQIYLQGDLKLVENFLRKSKEILEKVAKDALKSMEKYHGGFRELSWRTLTTGLVLEIKAHVGESMGANIMNEACEYLGRFVEKSHDQISVVSAILSNLSLDRWAKATCMIPWPILGGEKIARKIQALSSWAQEDPYRAATHNKGIFNGIDPLVLATGNDWRAVEAGAHAYAARSGQYRGLSQWHIQGESLVGSLKMPMALGTVGGVTSLHPHAALSLALLKNPSAQKLGEIAVASGLAQNLASLKALASEGIQKGHQRLHENNHRLRQEPKEGNP